MTALMVEAAARSAALVIMAWLVLSLGRLRNPHIHKALWTAVVVASIGMPIILQVHVMPVVAAPLVLLIATSHGSAVAQPTSLQTLWEILYLVPAVLLLLRVATGWVRMWRIRRAAPTLRALCAYGVDVRVSADVSSPVTFGRTILLPEEFTVWSASKLTAVLSHERAHVLHRDCYVLWLARLATCVFWFDPLAWWVARRLAELAEQTSDEAAVESLRSRADYAEILLGLAAARSSTLTAAMARSGLSARIGRVLSGAPLARALKRWQLALVIATALPVVTAAAIPLRTAAALATRGTTPTAVAKGASVAPHVVSSKPLDAYYPPRAKDEGIDGVVKLAVTLDSAGRVTETKVLSERPMDMGFGSAASDAAHAMRYSNPTGHAATFALRMKFALSRTPRR